MKTLDTLASIVLALFIIGAVLLRAGLNGLAVCITITEKE